MVGAVIVKDGKVVGEGFYTWDGVHHAEVLALQQAGDCRTRLNCLHITRTLLAYRTHTALRPGPDRCRCARVVTAMEDPDPRVNGKGLAMLRDAGIAVESGLLQSRSRSYERSVPHATSSTKRPFGILKIAMTLDGKIATAHGESQWITSEDSRASVQASAAFGGCGRDRQRDLSERQAPTDRPDGLAPAPRTPSCRSRSPGARGEDCPAGFIIRGALSALREELRQREIQSFMLECGPDLAFSALEAGIIDKIVAFIAPTILGGREVPAIGGAGIERLSDAIRLHDWTVTREDRYYDHATFSDV